MKIRLLAILTTIFLISLTACSTTDGNTDLDSTPPADDATINNTYYQCLINAGVPATVSEDGTVSYTTETDEQAKLYEEADLACQAQIKKENPHLVSSQDELNTLYDRMTALQKCVASNGIAVGEWPSREVFIENDGNYSVPVTVEPLEFEQVKKLCPKETAALP